MAYLLSLYKKKVTNQSSDFLVTFNGRHFRGAIPLARDRSLHRALPHPLFCQFVSCTYLLPPPPAHAMPLAPPSSRQIPQNGAEVWDLKCAFP